MIQTHEGDLLSVTKGIIVHGCNCQGVMGSGVAAVIREKYPEAYAVYRKQEEIEGLTLGNISIYGVDENLIIINALTQFYCGNDKSIRYVSYDAMYDAFLGVKVIAEKTALPVHFPLIGCGLANGDWKIVEPIIESALGPYVEKHLWVLPSTEIIKSKKVKA